MKKSVLLIAAGLVTAAVSAQSVQMASHEAVSANQNFSTKAVAESTVKAPQLKKTIAQKMDPSMKITPLTSAANGVYYKQPAGTMYLQYGADGMGYRSDIIQYQAYSDVVFYDECQNPQESSWSFGTSSLADLEMTVEEDGRSLIWSSPSIAEGYFYPVFTLSNGSYSYTLGEDGRSFLNGYSTRMAATNAISPLGFLTDHNSAAGYYGWSGFNTKHYLFGAGSMIDEGVEYKFVGAAEKLPAPMSPLYVESIDMPCYTFSESNAIPEGTNLTLDLYIGEDKEATVTLTASAEDFTYMLEDDGSFYFISDDDYGHVYVGNLHFSVKGEDAFGVATEEPFVLNDSSYVVLSMPEGVDLGFGAYQNYAPDALENAEILLDDGTSVQFMNSYQFKVVFNGIFDQILNRGDVVATDGKSHPSYYVEISNDGTSSKNGIFSDLPGALFYTATEWFTEEGEENYTIYTPENFPTWITGMIATPYGDVSESSIADTYTIGFTAEALPQDVTGRGYFVYIQGRGVISELPIFVYQGDIEAAWQEAVNTDVISEIRYNEKKAPRSYNIFGMPVTSDYKGFLVVDGQKQIRF